MANPQIENGYTRIANEILEMMAKIKLSPTQYRIIFVVWRYTYGFQRKTHQLSLTFLAEATGCDLRLVQREVKKLISLNVLKVEQSRGKTREIGFNKNFKLWQIDVDNKTIGEIDNGEIDNGEIDNGEIDNGEIDNGTIGEIDNGTIGEIDNQERKKENIKETDYKSIYDYYLTLDLKKHRTFTEGMIKAIKKAMKENKYDIEYCKVLLDRHKKVIEASKNNKYPVQVRGFEEFFGQKVYGATHLICSEYDEGGKYYDQYIKPDSSTSIRVGVPPSESVLGKREEDWL